jgi:hypothetical protein
MYIDIYVTHILRTHSPRSHRILFSKLVLNDSFQETCYFRVPVQDPTVPRDWSVRVDKLLANGTRHERIL